MDKNEQIREIIVHPLSARSEALLLTLAIAVIAGLMGLHFYLLRAADDNVTLLSSQRKDIFLKNQAPLMYRSLCTVAEDIVDIYDEQSKWPQVRELEQQSLPPFAEEFLPAGLRGYIWTVHIDRGAVDYFGINKNAAAGEKAMDPLEDSFMLRIIDLEQPGHPALPSSVKPDSGRRYFWQVWHYPAERQYPGQKPAEKGWKWIINSSSVN